MALVLGLVGAILGSIAATGPGWQAREGGRLLRQGQFSAGLATLEAVLAGGGLGTEQGAVRLNLSYAYLARRDTAQAGIAVLPLLTDPDAVLRARAWVQQGRIAAWAGRPAEAVAAWETALRLAPAQSDQAGRARRAAQWHLAESAWQAGEAGSVAQFAALAAQPAPPHDPYIVAATLRLAQIRAASEPRSDPAGGAAAGPPDLTLGDAPFLNLPGHDEGLPPETWITQVDGLEAALLDALTLPDLSPASHAAFWGVAWGRMGEWRAAGRLLEHAVAADPTLADGYAYLGLAYQRTGLTLLARLALQKAVALAPDRPLGHHLLARYYLDAGLLPRAGRELDWLETHGADPLLTLLDRARWFRLQGDQLSAEQTYLAAAQLAGPLDATAPNPALLLALFYQDYATWACAQGRPAAERAVAARPGPAEFDALGWATHLCYADAAALPLLDQAARLAPRDPAIAYHQGIVLRALGAPARAQTALRRAIDYDPGGPWERRASQAMSDER